MGVEGAPADGRMDDAIAVVGMACRFPGDATSVEAFWEMIRDGKDAWSEIPEDRFNAKGWYHPDPNRPGSVSRCSLPCLADLPNMPCRSSSTSRVPTSSRTTLQRLMPRYVSIFFFWKADATACCTDSSSGQFFSISTAEAVSMDPQQRMLLEVVYEALDSGMFDCPWLRYDI